MFGRAWILSLLFVVLISTIASSEVFYHYEGTDTSDDGIRLLVFNIEDSYLKVGSTIFANSTFQNINKDTIYDFTSFIIAKRPDGEIIEYKGSYKNELYHLETIDCNVTIELDQPGNWSIYPFYRFYIYAGGEGERTGKEYWHAYNFTVEDIYPDLTVSNIDCRQAEKLICVDIMNAGEKDVLDNFSVKLYINGSETGEEMVPSLLAGESFSICFEYNLGNIPLNIGVFVDEPDKIREDNEDNNYLEIRYMPDRSPPNFIEGPSANPSFNHVIISWKTDEESKGYVEYGKRIGEVEGSIKSADLKKSHEVEIDGLEPCTLYYYRVTVWDRFGNKRESRLKFFRTLYEDNIKPSIEVNISKNVSGIIKIETDVNDDTGVDRVSFYLDNRPIYTDYSPPFDFTLISRNFENGLHSFEARVFDVNGNTNFFNTDIMIENERDIPLLPQVIIENPSNNSEVIGDIPITAWINHSNGIERVEFWIDGKLECVEYCYTREVLVDSGRLEGFADARSMELFEYNLPYLQPMEELPGYSNQGFPNMGKFESYQPYETSEMGEGLLRVAYGDKEYEELPFEKTFVWYAKSLEEISQSIYNGEPVENKSTRIEVRAYDEFGNVGSDSITVYHKWESPPEASLYMVRRVTRKDHYFIVNVTVRNSGYSDASNIEITEKHLGFQIGQVVYTSRDADQRFVFGVRRSGITVPYEEIDISIPNLPAWESWHYSYEIFPLLFEGMSANTYRIGSEATIRYHSGIREKVKDYNQSYEPSPGWTWSEVRKAFQTSDYIIVTDPLLLYSYNAVSSNDVDQLLLAMAELAREKKGIIGYVLTSVPAYGDYVDNLIEEWGNNYLNDSWEGDGYLLIVGETEIIPSFIKSWDRDYDWDDETIYCTDYPYASTRGEEISPELHVGRIIGNTASDLIIPIRSSLDVHYGRAIFIKGGGGKAVCISGWGNGEGDFWSCIDSIGSKLQDFGFDVVKIRGRDYSSNQVIAYMELCNNSINASVICHRNHGNEDGRAWSGIISSHPGVTRQNVQDIDFGNARPFVISFSCCSGQYEDNPNYYPGGENGIAEGFLKKGAGVYIGSTEISMHNTNNEYSGYFFEHWLSDPDKSIAEAWKETRRYAADEWWYENDRYWSAEYQFYGDPKFGVE